MTDLGLPVNTLKDAAPHLRRPFTAAAVKWKVQTVLGENKGALIVGYIDARLVIERLNLVCPHLWFDAYEPTPKGNMWCHLTVDGITRSDVGEGIGKGLVSDALKRAAVHFGIGVPLYAIPSAKLWVGDKDSELRFNYKKVPEIDERTDAKLRARYDRWLKVHGIKAFGDPLDHGDSDQSQGDHEVDDAPAGQQALAA